MTRVFSWFAAFCVTCALVASPAMAADEPESKPRVKLFMSSADRVLGDLEWIIAELAKEKGQWEQNIFPSLDIFLLGVDRDKPIRFDAMIGGEDPGETATGTYRFAPCIPVEKDGKGIRDFIKENLQPIGIDVRQRSRGGYYSLDDVYKGWMRMVDEYACIGMYESDVPKGMPHPKESHDELIKSGFDIALELNNSPAQTEERTKSFEVLQANMLDATKPKDGESEAVFALRKATLQQNLEKFGGLFEQAKRVTIGWITDVDKQTGRADLYGEGLPDTGLAKFIDMISAEPSAFAAVPVPEDPAFSFRVNLPFDELWQRHLSERYQLLRPVTQEKIDASEQITSSEKAPAKEAIDLLIDMLETGATELGRIDLFVDMTKTTKTEDGPHVIVVGIRAVDGKKADGIVKLIPEAHKQWKVEMDADTVGETSIHKIDIADDLPASLADAFGDSGLIYVGTSTDIVWICGGDGSLELLKERIAQVADAEPPAEVSPVFGEIKMHAHTLLKLYDALVVEMGWNPLGQIQVEAKGPRTGDGAGLQPIDAGEMREIATRALADIDDRVSGQARRVDNHAEGEVLVAPGIMRAVGKIVAKIASDNL